MLGPLKISSAILMLLTAFIVYPHTAFAGIEACGDIYLESTATCRVETSGGCVAMCEPAHFVTTCRTKVYKACRKECTVTAPTLECTGSCEADCKADCEVNPGQFDCHANCSASCISGCKSDCAGDAGCESSCQTTCSGECDASCEVTAPSADCSGKCEASCDGYCRITPAYVECQNKCQDRTYKECETELQGGCELACTKPEGALFCDGQFIDDGGTIQKCIDALENLDFSVEVKGGIEISTSGCAYAPQDKPRSFTWGIFGLGVLVLGLGIIRLRKRK